MTTIGHQRRRRRHETIDAGERARLPMRRRLFAYCAAVALPAALAAAAIPLRMNHGAAIAVVLTACVVAISALGAAGPAVVAAVAAAGAYDFFLTEPYYSFTIDKNDEVVTAATLLTVGLVVGVLRSRTVHLQASATTRKAELRHLIDFAQATSAPVLLDELADLASQHIIALLDLRNCTWQPGQPTDTASPVLLPTGDIMGLLTDLNPDRAILPDHLQLPAQAGGSHLGTFDLTCHQTRATSHEERHTAATIATLYATAALRPGVS